MASPRVLGDVMLGRLARWLRVLGVDTTSADGAAPDVELVRMVSADERILLTRDRHLLRELRPARVIAIESEVPLEQLRQVVAECALAAPAELFTRCLLCNELLSDIPDEVRAALLPPRSRDVPGAVRRCMRCGRVYWRGAHARRMRDTLERTFPGWLAKEPYCLHTLSSEARVAEDMVVLRKYGNEVEAQLAAAVLAANGIPAQVFADTAGGAYPSLALIFPVRLVVKAADADLASEILDTPVDGAGDEEQDPAPAS